MAKHVKLVMQQPKLADLEAVVVLSSPVYQDSSAFPYILVFSFF